ncbi:MAG: hypothetical protein HY305_00605 [Sphingobacteriales bacterium]|nr:hypothetical protein [Sphingobacteriales bacterium]
MKLDHIRLSFNDAYGGTNVAASILSLETRLNKFQPDRLQFDVKNLITKGVSLVMVISKEGEKDTTTSKHPLQLLAGDIDLSDINISFENKLSGLYYGNTIRHLLIADTKFDMATEKATVKKVLLDSSFVKFVSPKSVAQKIVDTVVEKSASWDIVVKELQLNNDHVQYDNNNIAPKKEGVDFSHLDLQQIKINTKNVRYSTDSIIAGIDQLHFIDKSGFSIDTTHARIIYSSKGIQATELYVKTPQSVIQNSLILTYDNIRQVKSAPQNSKVAVKLSNTVIAVNDLYMLVPSIKKSMPPEKFRNNIVKLNTGINGTLQKLNIPYLQLAGFSGTVVNAKAVLYNIMDTNKMAYDITIYNSNIPKTDILKFLPANNSTKEITSKIPVVLKLNTHLKGNLKNTVAYLNINSAEFALVGKAAIKNLNDPAKLSYAIVLDNSRIERSFINSIVPKGTMPNSISLPETILLKGSAIGDMNNISPNVQLGGTYGIITAKGYVHNFKNKEAATYDLNFTTDNFALGKFLKKDTVMGSVTLGASAKGRGFNYKTMQSVIKADVKSIGFKKYEYKNISLNADLNRGNVISNGSVNDSNLQLNFNATANVGGKYPRDVEATIVLDTVQLKKLNLYKENFAASFKTYIKAENLDPENLNVYVVIDSSKLKINNKNYVLDSIVAIAKKSDNVNDLYERKLCF